ncbi:hypothetical protein [Stenotrophomonas sp.]|uniref:hypothetical protein n=1 Tax=Stenotrophomonas sp. TaxID=69392 RepID=UPI001313471E|nr:hypothetical protein [Stenotrophomonas sp.]
MNESLQAAIAAVEASNPTPAADALPNAGGSATESPADEQGNDAATGEEGHQADQPDDSGDSAASDGEGAPAQRQNKGVGKRINELTREKYEAIRRAEAAEQRANELEKKSQQGAARGAAEGKPKLEDFDFDHDQYVDALTDWRLNQKLAERETIEHQRQQQSQEQERAQQFHSRLSAYQAANPGKWEAATQAPVNFTPSMLEVIATSDIGPQIAVYLTENLDRADEISRMTPFAAAAALGRLEASMGAAKSIATPPKPTSVTKAPPPPSTVGGGSVVRKDLASMDVADHLEAVRAKRNR